jgi:signal transduction histidine kinase
LSKEKNHNELLNIINATVSHELRNPLNSIIAQNLEKRKLHEKMNNILRNEQIDFCDVRVSLIHLLGKLKDGNDVQESSADIMSFLIQDLLDYSQIKANKFRKNIKKFDITEAIEKVMCIQRKKSIDLGIDFYVDYINVYKKTAITNMHSPLIITD